MMDIVERVKAEPWKQTQYHCVRCGVAGLMMRDDGGDVYTGEQHICLKCEATFCFHGAHSASDDWDRARLAVLRSLSESQTSVR